MNFNPPPSTSEKIAAAVMLSCTVFTFVLALAGGVIALSGGFSTALLCP